MISRNTFLKGVLAAGVSTWLFGEETISNYGKEDTFKERIYGEYESRVSSVMREICPQLEEQGKMNILPVFEEIIRTKVLNELQDRYQIPIADMNGSTANTTYLLPDGGVIGYNGFGGTTVVDTYMDYNTTQTYLVGVNASIQASSIISYILGHLPAWGSAFSLLLTLHTSANSAAVQSVNNAGGYGYIISVSHPLEGSATVLIGWSQYPVAIVPSDATNVHVEDFSLIS
ncbi:MAG: hypothetical protein IJ773_10305 [Lachnospiraceae bacterium]|nr:hypothetical protein [Lachnospiraceae bacterium]